MNIDQFSQDNILVSSACIYSILACSYFYPPVHRVQPYKILKDIFLWGWKSRVQAKRSSGSREQDVSTVNRTHGLM